LAAIRHNVGKGVCDALDDARDRRLIDRVDEVSVLIDRDVAVFPGEFGAWRYRLTVELDQFNRPAGGAAVVGQNIALYDLLMGVGDL
jgi:hypothetical protein